LTFTTASQLLLKSTIWLIKMAKMTTLKEFESIFPTIVEDLLAHAKQYGAPQMALDWYKAVRARNIFGEFS
jgi:hypothetical protein